jgi:hypothetical protein
VSDRSTPGAFLGDWRITTMELWAKGAIELLGPGMFTFEDEAFGEFRFIAVRGWMDCRFAERDGKPLVEFSWQGKDEMDDASGRGGASSKKTARYQAESASIRAMTPRSPRCARSRATANGPRANLACHLGAIRQINQIDKATSDPAEGPPVRR